MISETATELVRANDFTLVYLAVIILISVKVFVYFFNKCK